MESSKSRHFGFTLIELLVVIAIIGLLATLSVIALSSARAKSRDSKRLADIKQMQTSLEMYYTETSHYPSVGEFNSGAISYYSPNIGTTTYMNIIPAAPTPNDGPCSETGNGYIYSPTVDGSSYTISFCIGGPSNHLVAGPKCATPGGIGNIDCNGSGSGGSGIPTSTSPYFSRAYGTTRAETFRDGFQTSDGGYVAIGGADSYSSFPLGGYSRWIVKIGPDLNQQWSRGIATSDEIDSSFYGVQPAGDGSYVAAGKRVIYNNNPDIKATGWIAKLDGSAGATIWAADFGVSTSSNARTEFDGLRKSQDGNFLAFGLSDDTDPNYVVVCDPYYCSSPCFGCSTSYTGGDGLVVKYNTSGQELWHRTFGNLHDNDSIADAVELSDGSWVFLEFTIGQNFNWGSPVYRNTLFKTDASGNELWHKDIGVNLDDFNSLVSAPDGGFVVAGRRVTTYSTSTAFQHVSYLKLDSAGNEVWRKDLTEGNYSYSNDITADGDGTYTIIFHADYAGGYRYQPVIMKMDSSGNEISRKYYGGPREYSIGNIQKMSDGYLMFGSDIVGPYGSSDGWLMRTDENGNYE